MVCCATSTKGKIRDFQPHLNCPGCITEEGKTDLYFKMQALCFREKQIDASDKEHGTSRVLVFSLVRRLYPDMSPRY